MTSDAQLDEVIAYLSRLTGETLTADQPIRLRSLQRAAMMSWSRQRGLTINFDGNTSDGLLTARGLVSGGSMTPSAPAKAGTPAVALALAPSAITGGFAGIGIDIEETATLPVTDDYREHHFYRDNFTPVEIAHCVSQPDVRASFCGTWAAKEAILKSGLANAPGGRFDVIEITRDALGRPVIPGGQLSISHTPTTAVAVCIALGLPAQIDVRQATRPMPLPEPQPAKRWPLRAFAAISVVGLTIAAVFVGMHFSR